MRERAFFGDFKRDAREGQINRKKAKIFQRPLSLRRWGCYPRPPAEAPPLAEFNMKSQVALHNTTQGCFYPKNQETSPQSAQSPQRVGGAVEGIWRVGKGAPLRSMC